MYKEGFCDSTSLGSVTRAFRSIRVYPEASGLMSMSLGHIKSLIDGVLTVRPKGLYFGQWAGCCGFPKLNRMCSRCYMGSLISSGCCANCGVTSPVSCASCNGSYRAAEVTNLDHSPCIPFAVIKAQMDIIIDKITGLQYSDFVRNTENKQTLTTHSSAKDMWECLMFH